ncbi:MAG: hypothetical protein LBN06_02865 [Prevotellaceae bacterium]|jgi:hypothetical protein|nr:hypothetical protein [Prevotellaceae bacterium]
MWHLDYLSETIENQYVDLLLDKIKGKRDSENIVELSNDKLEKLLRSKPNELWAMKDDLMALADKQTFERIFDYKKWISHDKENSYKIAGWIGQNTCVYCNRQYIFMIKGKLGGYKVTRPEFDHYLPKSKYPFFALSLYNLIPSCHICNSSCKGTKELPEIMNPYLTEGDRDYFKFTYSIDGNGEPDTVRAHEIYKEQADDVEQMLNIFKIEDIYSAHARLELKDLYAFATKYSPTYLQEVLANTVNDLRITQEEAYRILFGAEMLPENDNDRPLSKLKRDILEELHVISRSDT